MEHDEDAFAQLTPQQRSQVHCQFAQSGCNAPESECLGVCLTHVGKRYKDHKIAEILYRASHRAFLVLLDDGSTVLLETEAQQRQFAQDVIEGKYDASA